MPAANRPALTVVPSMRWRCTATGRTASVHGAAPWGAGPQPRTWVREQVGYTWRLPDGTIGLGRKPAPSLQHALQAANRHPMVAAGRWSVEVRVRCPRCHHVPKAREYPSCGCAGGPVLQR